MRILRGRKGVASLASSSSADVRECSLTPHCGADLRLLQVAPRLRDRILLVNGVSKAYAMTGWRIGYSAGPAFLIEAMATLQSQSTSNACVVGQKVPSAVV